MLRRSPPPGRVLVVAVIGAILEGLFWLAVVGLTFFVPTAVLGASKRNRIGH